MKKGFDYTGVSVALFCHDGKGNFGMTKRGKNCRDEHGCWDIVGGGIEFGDSINNTIQKELEEELCTDVLDKEFLGHREVHREHDGKKTHWIQFDFKVLIDRNKVKNGEPHKFDDIKWFTLKNLPDPLHSQFPHFHKAYKDRLI